MQLLTKGLASVRLCAWGRLVFVGKGELLKVHRRPYDRCDPSQGRHDRRQELQALYLIEQEHSVDERESDIRELSKICPPFDRISLTRQETARGHPGVPAYQEGVQEGG